MNKSNLFFLSSLLVCFCFFACTPNCCTNDAKKVSFDDITAGKTFASGDNLISDGQEFVVSDFTFNNGTVINSGHALVDVAQFTGNTGNELNLSNVNLMIGLGETAKCVSFAAINKGGELNIEINGEYKNFNLPADIDGTKIGGVTVSATGGANLTGQWTFSGAIDSFSVGGQEFYIDDLCIN